MSIGDVLDLIDDVLNDTTLPKNVRKALEEAKKALNESQDISVKVMKAIYLIDEVIEDPNLMPHTRMQLWNVMSALEAVKVKK